MAKQTNRMSTSATPQKRGPDVHEIASQLFVRAWTPGSTRTAEHMATIVYDAAEAFVTEARKRAEH